MRTDSANGLVVHPSWGSRLVGIEGLRGAAAMLVLIYHAVRLGTPNASATKWLAPVQFFDQGLTLFFVLSGFLLFRPFAHALIEGAPLPRIGRFWENRALRVWPAYVVVLAVVSYVFQAARLPGVGPTGDTVRVGALDGWTFLTDAFIVQTYSPTYIRTGLEVAWTLTVETAFYVVLPLLAICVSRFSGRSTVGWVRAAMPVALLIALGLATKGYLAIATAGQSPVQLLASGWANNWSSVLARSFLAHADLFGYGMLAALVYVVAKRHPSPLKLLRFSYLVGVGAAVVFRLSAFHAHDYADSAFGVLFSMLLLYTVGPTRHGGPNWLGRLLDLPVPRYLGLISFSVYLWHLAFIRWAQAAGFRVPDTVAGAGTAVIVVVAASVVLASMTYFLVEKQALKLKRPYADAGTRLVRREKETSTTGSL